MIEEIKKAIHDDLPSIYHDDIKNWNNLSEEIKDMIINQINNIIDFQYRKFSEKYPKLKNYDLKKLKWLGYKNSNKNMTIEIYLSYERSENFIIKFNKYKATRAEVIDAINTKITINNFSEAKSRNWESLEESIAIGNKYRTKILNILKKGIEVKDQKVYFNKNRFKHSGVSVVNSKLILDYNYLLLNKWVNLEVELKNDKEIEETIIKMINFGINEFVPNNGGINLSEISNWKDFKNKIDQGINPVLNIINKIKEKILMFTNLLDGIIPFDINKLNTILNISKIPNIGPLDSSFTINLKLFNNIIPIRFHFNNEIDSNMIDNIKNIILEKN